MTDIPLPLFTDAPDSDASDSDSWDSDAPHSDAPHSDAPEPDDYGPDEVLASTGPITSAALADAAPAALETPVVPAVAAVAAEHWSTRLAVFDLETTGVDVETARIVTATVAVLDAEGRVERREDWIVDPGVEIPAGAAAVHGISTERARAEGMPAADGVAGILASVARVLADSIPLVAYNASYDLSVLDREARRHGLEPLHEPTPVIDPYIIDKAVDRYRKGKRTLTMTAEVYGVLLADAHDAGADAVAAGHVAQALARVHGAALDMTAAQLHAAQVAWAAEQAASFQEYMRRVKDPSFTADGSWPLRVIAAAVARPLGRVDEVVLDCADPETLALFWSRVLGGTPLARDENWASLDAPGMMRLAFQRVPEPKGGKNRLHLDVLVDDVADAAAQAVELGARRVGELVTDTAGSFHVLQDPEGNEWCVVRPRQS